MYTELADCLHKDSDAVKLKRNHKCFNQCLMQMGVARAKIAYVVVWTTHGMVKDNSTFDKGPWESMKRNFEMFHIDFYLNLFNSE